MGNLADLKVALWQREVHEGSPSRSREELADAVQRATALGADCLVTAAFDGDGMQGVIPCGTSTSECDESAMTLHTADGDYRIGVGSPTSDCDFSVCFDGKPWTKDAQGHAVPAVGMSAIVVAPVGIRNAGHAVRCFDGDTKVFDAQGRILRALRDDFEEEFALVSLSEPGTMAKRCNGKLLQALTSTIRRFDSQVLGGSLPWVIGLSGGLDSSIVASLLVLALGESRVVGYSLSSEYNTTATKDNAACLADALGIRFHAATIGDTVFAVEHTAESCGYGRERIEGLVHENVQARTRGSLLCTFAAIEGGVVANNGNFVESALGYCTLYGDAIGALAPIADLAKVDLFDLARDINATFGAEVIPGNLLPQLTDDGYTWETMPSAELSEGQRDPMKWFYHDWLVRKLRDDPDFGAAEALAAYRDDRLESAGMGKWIRFYGLDDPHAFINDLEWVLRQMCSAVFKRIQAPPAILLSNPGIAWGDGEVQRRWEPDGRYLELKEQLLGGGNGEETL